MVREDARIRNRDEYDPGRRHEGRPYQARDCYLELFEVAGAKPLPDHRKDPSADLRVHGTVHIAFQVQNLAAAVKELKGKGAEIAMGPVDTLGIAFAFIRDNAGNCFKLLEYKQPAAASR